MVKGAREFSGSLLKRYNPLPKASAPNAIWGFGFDVSLGGDANIQSPRALWERESSRDCFAPIPVAWTDRPLSSTLCR